MATLSRSQAAFRTACFVGVAAALFGAPAPTLANRGGPPTAVDGSTGAGGASCRACHGNTLGAGSVQIENFPAQYEANVTYNLIIRISDPSRFGAGFQASVQTAGGAPVGTLIRTDITNTQLAGRTLPTAWRGIHHTASGVSNSVANWSLLSNAAVYGFQWQAPMADAGPVTIWAAGNAINDDHFLSGDLIYLADRTADFVATPVGACCDEATGQCMENELQADCGTAGGRYGGDDSTCATINPPCVASPGACCDEGIGQCVDDVLLGACVGRWGGPGSTCATIDPTCAAVPGACCDDSTGQCDDAVLMVDCSGRWGGPESLCTALDPPCVPPTGACCDGNDGGCTEGVPLAGCFGEQRSWTVDTLCSELDPPCAEHTGACCDRLSGDCTDGVPGSACVGSQRTWTKGVLCGEVACLAVTGACCDHDPFGVCLDEVTQAECQCPTCEWVKLGFCLQLECVHTSIPAVSEWGLLILALLLFIGAKLGFGRFSAPATGGV